MEEAVKDAAKYANFAQGAPRKAWDKGFSGEKELDELAMETYKYFKSY